MKHCRIAKLLGLLGLFGLLPAGCGPADAPVVAPATPTSKAAPPARPTVASLSPQATRFVLALGATEQLIAADAASARVSGLVGLPQADRETVAELAPDLLLVPEPVAPGDPVVAALEATGGTVVEFAPHDLEDVFELCRDLGARIAGAGRAARLETAIGRPLAEIGGSAFGRPRPLVLGLLGVDPVEVAGGHSFETDLIEIAGGRSVTHGGLEARLDLGPRPWEAVDVDLILLMSPQAPSEAQLRAIRAATRGDPSVAAIALEASDFWLEPDQASARRLRALLAPIAASLEREP